MALLKQKRNLEQKRNQRVEEWLSRSPLGEDSYAGVVLAASERTARSLRDTYHASQLSKRYAAWITPEIYAWDAWVRERWMERNQAGEMLLNALQEHALWLRVIRGSAEGAALLHPDKLAAAAQQAYGLLANHAPAALQTAYRAGWTADAAVFSLWIAEFDEQCRRDSVVSESRLALELSSLLRTENRNDLSSSSKRASLLLSGFVRLTASQRELLVEWGEWRQDDWEESAGSTLVRGDQGYSIEGDNDGSDLFGFAHAGKFFSAEYESSELESCVRWIRSKVAVNPEARLLVLVPGLNNRRGEVERALMQTPPEDEPEIDFEFSLGLPLNHVGMARSALLLLRWLDEPISEAEVDWLLSSGHCVASALEEVALAEAMRSIRNRGMERPDWPLQVFMEAAHRGLMEESIQDNGSSMAADKKPSGVLVGVSAAISAWTLRLASAREKLRNLEEHQSPIHWAYCADDLLQRCGWPGYRPLTSVAFQVGKRWQTLLEECGSVGFDGSEMSWTQFHSTLAYAASTIISALESRSAPVQIMEPVESAGQLADGIWFLGADEESWPVRGTPHPLLPAALQRKYEMPHSSPAADWNLARRMTQRVLLSADEVVFSCAMRSGETEMRPSRLALKAMGMPVALPTELLGSTVRSAHQPSTEGFEDTSAPPYGMNAIKGGSGTLTNQSLCPFKAFAAARLDAGKWDPAEVGLNAQQRGMLLHQVLRKVWAGKNEGGISTLDELLEIENIEVLVGQIVDAVLSDSNQPNSKTFRFLSRFPKRLIKLEARRLTRLVTEWLRYERTRLPFRVKQRESGSEITIACKTMRLQLDRIDELPDGSQLIIDYKSGMLKPSAWSGARPDDLQLPLYATFAVTAKLEGLLIARVRPGNMEFCGRMRDARATLQHDLTGNNGLVKHRLTEPQLLEWRETIERLGRDFLDGRAEVDPKDGAKTCEQCHLQAVCRIYENDRLAVELEGDDDASTDAADSEGEYE